MILALGLAACESPLSSSERLRLAAGEEKWAARGDGDYSIEMRRSCFCAPEACHGDEIAAVLLEELEGWLMRAPRTGGVQAESLAA